MAEILLMRHAKSSHPPGVADRHRPLSPRGKDSALAVGRALAEFAAVPDLVITSPARRAADTAALVCESAGWAASIAAIDGLYSSGVDALLVALGEHRAARRILAVGHEPTWSSAVSTIIGGGIVQMVTAAVACIESPLPPQPETGVLRWMIHPRLLAGDAT